MLKMLISVGGSIPSVSLPNQPRRAALGIESCKKPSLLWLLKTPGSTSQQWWLLVPTPDPRTETSLPSLSLPLHEVLLLLLVLRFCPRSITLFSGAILAAALSQPRKAPKNGSSASLTGPAILHLCLAKGIVSFTAVRITVVYKLIQERLILNVKKNNILLEICSLVVTKLYNTV